MEEPKNAVGKRTAEHVSSFLGIGLQPMFSFRLIHPPEKSSFLLESWRRARSVVGIALKWVQWNFLRFTHGRLSFWVLLPFWTFLSSFQYDGRNLHVLLVQTCSNDSLIGSWWTRKVPGRWVSFSLSWTRLVFCCENNWMIETKFVVYPLCVSRGGLPKPSRSDSVNQTSLKPLDAFLKTVNFFGHLKVNWEIWIYTPQV